MSVAFLRRVRSSLAPVALFAYALPIVIGLLADIGHGARHLGETLREQRSRAVAMGLVHVRAEGPSHMASPGVTHTHDGSTHTHARWLGSLLRAADDAEPVDQAIGGAPSLAPHLLPPASSLPLGLPTLRAPGDHGEPLRFSALNGGPLHPPPRV